MLLILSDLNLQVSLHFISDITHKAITKDLNIDDILIHLKGCLLLKKHLRNNRGGSIIWDAHLQARSEWLQRACLIY